MKQDTIPTEISYENARIIRDTKTKLQRKRIWELDFLRGICILLMIIDHLLYDISNANMFASSWLQSGNQGAILAVQRAQNYMYNIQTSAGEPVRDIVHIIVLWCFFLLCGFGCYFSKNNIKRTCQIGVCAGLITLATYLFDVITNSTMIVRFGVLHMLAFCCAIYTVVCLIVRAIVKKEGHRTIIISCVCIAIGIASLILNNHFNSLIAAEGRFNAPNSLAWLHGYYYYDGYSSDIFPLLEYLHMSMFGAAIAPLIYRKRKSILPMLDGKWNKPFCFFGRHTLIIVILHQLIITGVLALVSFLFITPGSFGL